VHFLLYSLIGGLGVLIDLAAFNFLYFIFSQKYYMLYHVIGYLLGTIVSFFLNFNFNFKVRTRLKARFASFIIIGFLGLVVSSVFVLYVTYFLNLDARISKVLSLLLVLILQYSLNKRITFRKYFIDKD